MILSKIFSFFLYLILGLTSLDVVHVQAQQPGISTNKYDLVICAVFQNEDFFLKEWIEFHRLMGVQHFYLYNNLSTDNYLEILQPYIAAGIVDLMDYAYESHNQFEHTYFVQLPLYNHALHIAKQTARWAAFIDIDEFLVPVQHSNLVSLLAEYEQYAGLIVNWQAYGTSGKDSLLPDQLITENLLLKAPTEAACNRMHKSIVQPLCVAAATDPHYFLYHDGFFAVNSNGEQAQVGDPVVVDKIRINHYWFGTKDWFIHNKIPRRSKWGLSLLPEHVDLLISSCNQVEDDTILRFTPLLKKVMFPLQNEKILKNESIDQVGDHEQT